MKRIAFLTAVLLAACTARPTPTLDVAATSVLQPYLTATASPTPTPPLEPVETPLPTATPFTYVVRSGDTLSGIAEKFRIRLEVLQAANPGISPNNMPVGVVLTIPADLDNPSLEPTPTPVPLPVRQVTCYPSRERGMWCLVVVQNDTADTIENVSCQVTLYDPRGGALATRTAFSLLNILPAGASLPLVVFFPPEIPLQAQPRAQMLTATRILQDDVRYLPASIENVLVQIDWIGRTAQVSGKVLLPPNAVSPAGRVWLLAAAYAADGRVVGARRWESTTEVPPGGKLDFAFAVFSLGPPIERVDLFVEARPK